MKKPIVISISTQKGGVGKTTTVCALATVFAEKGYKVGVIDADPQSNSTDILGEPPYEKVNSITALMDPEFEGAISLLFNQSRHDRNIHLLPSIIQASYEWPQLYANINRFQGRIYDLLARHIKMDSGLKSLYDIILIDPPPSLDLPMINALAAADYVIVPMMSGDRFSLSGWRELRATIQSTINHTNPDLKILGVLITMHDPRFNVCQTNYDIIHDRFRKEGRLVFDTFISASVEVKTAHAHRRPITVFNKSHKVSKQYYHLTDELLKHLKALEYDKETTQKAV